MPRNDLRILCIEGDHDVGHIIRLALALDGAIEARIVVDESGAIGEVAGGFYPQLLLQSDKTDIDLRAKMSAALDIEPPPVIFLAVNNRVADLSRLMAGAPLGVIAKPFDPLNLSILIRSMIG